MLDLSKVTFIVSNDYLRKQLATVLTKISMAVFIETQRQSYRAALFLESLACSLIKERTFKIAGIFIALRFCEVKFSFLAFYIFTHSGRTRDT